MDAIDTGEQNDGGVGEGKRDYFSMLADRLIKDLENTVRVCQKVMTLNMKKLNQDNTQDDQWNIMRNNIKAEAQKILTPAQNDSQDKFMLLSKLLNMKENLVLQIFKSSVYRKLVVWKDLNIQLEEYQSYTVVEKVKEMNKYIEHDGYSPT
jgi:hypothetical protein